MTRRSQTILVDLRTRKNLKKMISVASMMMSQKLALTISLRRQTKKVMTVLMTLTRTLTRALMNLRSSQNRSSPRSFKYCLSRQSPSPCAYKRPRCSQL
jgi:hypothetical protein